MLTVAFASNWGLYRTFIEAGQEDVYVTEGYLPLVDMILANGKVKFNLFIEGVTARRIADRYPELADKIRRGIAGGQLEIGTYTYNHPVLSMIPYRDTFKQLEEGLKIDRQVWGVEPKGTMLPEVGWDPSLPRILGDLGITYLLMGKGEVRRDFPNIEGDFFHRPFTLKGIGNSQITALAIDSSDWQPGEQEVYIEGGVIQDAQQNVAEFQKRIAQIKGASDGAGLIMISKNDGEFVYEGTLKRKYGASGPRGGYFQYAGQSLGAEPRARAEEMKRGWDRLTASSDVCFKTVSEYLAQTPSGRTILLRPSYKAHREWLEGSEKLAAILDETRNEIRHAEYALKLAQKLGLDTARAEQRIGQAWLLLLEAEISTGRRACAHGQRPPAAPAPGPGGRDGRPGRDAHRA
jgi:hypothetical protein